MRDVPLCANPAILRGKLYALRPEVTPVEVEQYLNECSAGDDPLVTVYVIGRKKFLQINGFGQRERTAKYPGPSDSPQVADKGAQRTAYARAAGRRASTPTPTPEEGSAEGNQNGMLAERRSDGHSRELFDKLVESYPPAGRERMEKARETLRAVLAEESRTGTVSRAEVLQEIRDGVARWKLSERWQSGRVHLLHNWLRERLWREYPVAQSAVVSTRAGPAKLSKREQGIADFIG